MREAEALYRSILAADPNHAEATHLLGLLAHQCGHTAPAIELMERSIARSPDVFYYHNNLAEAYKTAGRYNDAARSFARSLALRPDEPHTMHSLGVALERAGRVEEATATLRAAMRRFPSFPQPYMSLGAMLEKEARYDEALELYERAVELNPNYAKARAARAGMWLLRGDFLRGWEEYEWRWRVEKFPAAPPPPASRCGTAAIWPVSGSSSTPSRAWAIRSNSSATPQWWPPSAVP